MPDSISTTTTDATPTPTGGGSSIYDLIIRAIGGAFDASHAATGQPIKNSQTAAAAADPFAGQRSTYQTLLQNAQGQLSDLLTKPGSFQMNAGEQFAENQGLEGVARHGNSMFGTTRAGGTAVGLDKYATGFAEQAYSNRVKQYQDYMTSLMGPAGVNAGSPAMAGQLLQGGFDNQNKTIGSAISGLAPAAAALVSSLINSGIPASIARSIASSMNGVTINETNDQGTGSIADTSGNTPTSDGYGGITSDDLRRAGFTDDQIRDFFGGGPAAPDPVNGGDLVGTIGDGEVPGGP